MKKARHIIMLITCILVVMAAAVQRDNRLMGHTVICDDKEESEEVVTEKTLSNGTQVINTTDLGKDISGYGGPTPLEIYLEDGRITEVKPLQNLETPDFFDKAASGLLTKWNGKTPDEALAMKVDAVTGATFSSRAIIGNVREGMLYVKGSSVQQPLLERMGMDAKYALALLVVLLAAIVPLLWKNKRYHTLQLVLNVVVLGLWSGTFLSWSLLVNFMSSGINVLTSLVPIVMLIVAFIYPLFGKKQYYCTNVCPFGSLQDLAGKANKKHKWKLSKKTVDVLTTFRQSLFTVLLVLMLTGTAFAWMDYELFIAFIWESASWVVIALAVTMVILALFVPRPYCRFVCPTGTLLKLSEGRQIK